MTNGEIIMLSKEDLDYGFTERDVEESMESFLNSLTGKSVKDV